MKNTFTTTIAGTALAAFLALGVSAAPLPQTKDAKDPPKDTKSAIKDQTEQSQKAATVFSEIMDAPDKGIPNNLIEKARCVAVFPSVLKAGFIVGGRGGRGVASCRTAAGWSAPAYFNLGGGSVGLQIGADSTDFVMLMMNDKGMNSLLSDQFTLGGDATVAAGPVGRQASAETDAKLNAEILSYSRSKGAFAGLELKGVVIKPDKDDMHEVYGGSVTAKDVLNGNKVTTPASVLPFPKMLGRYSTGVSTKPGTAK
jgi:SH3 domain-containing YSC84-like protein 1